MELITSATAIAVRASNVPMTYDAPPPAKTFAQSRVAYLVPWGTAAQSFAGDALRQGIRMHSVGVRSR